MIAALNQSEQKLVMSDLVPNERSKFLQNMSFLQRNSSVRLRKRIVGVKRQVVNDRRSDDFGYRLNSEDVKSTNNSAKVLKNGKVDTLDPGPTAEGIRHNLRPLLRNLYRKNPLGDIEHTMESDWGTLERGDEVNMRDFDLTDTQTTEEIRSYHSLQHQTRYIKIKGYNLQLNY